MIRLATAALLLLASSQGASQSAPRDNRFTPWIPPREQVERLDRLLERTIYHCEPFSHYARVYSGMIVNRRRLIVGTLVVPGHPSPQPPSADRRPPEPSKPGVFIVSFDDVPDAVSGWIAPDCRRMPFQYDVASRRFANF